MRTYQEQQQPVALWAGWSLDAARSNLCIDWQASGERSPVPDSPGRARRWYPYPLSNRRLRRR